MVELCRGVSVGDPGKERLRAHLEEGVARVLIIISSGRRSRCRRPESRTGERGPGGRCGASSRAVRSRRSRTERVAGHAAQITGGWPQSQRRVCGCVRSGPQRHGVRICRVSRLSFASPTRGPSDQGFEDICQDEPQDDAKLDHDALAGVQDATSGMLSIAGARTRRVKIRGRQARPRR
jgi:hypothetical protein